jgi:xanthine dehydrogenase small subunit
MGSRNTTEPIRYAVDQQIIPSYFLTIPERLARLNVSYNGQMNGDSLPKHLGGGTDLYVQQHETIVEETLDFLFDKSHLNGIRQVGEYCEMGGAVTVTDIANSPVFQQYFPRLNQYIKLISSTQIRNMATVAGNFTNASPIGDLTIFFLALDATLILDNGNGKREIPLRNFYKGYKILDKQPGEIIETIRFKLPANEDGFHFEKVCKRTHLDIASVNSALYIKTNNEQIVSAGLSAGGVGPTPMYLSRCSEWLIGKTVSAELVLSLIDMAQSEISPISDARGTEAYKRLLLSQLIKAHFIELFPTLPVQKLLHG